jgi:predicted unusual protein kinase regulating ubiquinone biosynthesis (AarF/ABC1/UbiB family)
MSLRTARVLWVAFQIAVSYAVYWIASFVLSAERRAAYKNRVHQTSAVQFRDAALSLKGLLIKVGQFMSARVDLLPEAYTKTLSQLQDQVPPAAFADIEARIVEELGAAPETLFLSFDRVPVAAASLGQVHRATLRDTARTEVAIKVQYPKIERIVACDVAALQWIVWALQKVFPHIRFDILYDEFSNIVQQELNYIAEGRRAERFRKNFEKEARVVAPEVIWKYTTRQVLTLTFVTGIKITEVAEMRRAGIDPVAVAELLAECYMIQLLRHHFFHGDPHPGNISVQPGPRLVFVDFGLMQEIRPQTYRGVQKMMLAIIDRDVPGIARALVDLGFIARSGRMREVEGVVSFFMERYRDAQPTSFQKITLGQVAQDLRVLFKAAPVLQIPNHFMLVGRTAGMLNGLCSRLDPDLNIIDLATPHARRMAKEGVPSLWREVKETLMALQAVPEALRTFLSIANSGRLRTEMSSEDVTGMLKRIYRLLRFAIGMVALALLCLAGWAIGG